MAFKFEKLEVFNLSLDYIDQVYDLIRLLPEEERFNLSNQMRRAVTSICLNIAEGSTGQTDAEQARFLGMALRSLIETVACQHIMRRRDYVEVDQLRGAYRSAAELATKIQALRNSLQSDKPWVREEFRPYPRQQPPTSAGGIESDTQDKP